MLKLLYSGALTAGGQQDLSEKSLGGLVSSTEVPNGSLNQLFGSMSYLMKKNSLAEYRGLFLKNETGEVISTLYAHLEYPNAIKNSRLLIAIESPVNNSIQSLPRFDAIPYGIEFTEPIGSEHKMVVINDFPVNAIIGLWIQRQVDVSGSPDSIADNDPNLEEVLANLPKTESVSLVFTY